MLLLFKSPPAMNVLPKVLKNFWNWCALRLCFGGLYTAAIVMSFNGSLIFIDVAWISASVYFNSS